jgi:hypothetical protein
VSERFCYAYVEDQVSRSVLVRLVEERNRIAEENLLIVEGFPLVRGGNMRIRSLCGSLLAMAQKGVPSLVLTDLDQVPCAPRLLRDWFSLCEESDPVLPKGLFFRVAVKEVEAWLMADTKMISQYLGIAEANFPSRPEELPDPKGTLFSILRTKGRRKFHRDMIPRPGAHIGPLYNPYMCEFVEQHWRPEVAAEHSASLAKAIKALRFF